MASAIEAVAAAGEVVRVVEGEREYLRRVPNIGVAQAIVVLVHCFGCDAEMELRKFERAADR